VPHVAAAAAILKQYIPALTPAQIRTAIQDGALEDANTGATPNDDWGYGKLRILQALKEADRTPPAWDTTVGAQSVVISCGVGATVSWNPATDLYKDPVQYRVYRDTVSGFTPSKANIIAITALTSHVDSVAAGTYYYVVRAEDSAIEPNEDTNTVEVSATVVDAAPTGCTPAGGTYPTDINNTSCAGPVCVNGFDLITLGLSFGEFCGGPYYNPDADVDADGVVGPLDLDALIVDFGSGCS
jgi:hypothetical protein